MRVLENFIKCEGELIGGGLLACWQRITNKINLFNNFSIDSFISTQSQTLTTITDAVYGLAKENTGFVCLSKLNTGWD